MVLTSLRTLCIVAVPFVGCVPLPLPLVIRVLASLVLGLLLPDDVLGFGYLVLYAVVFFGAGFPWLVVLDWEFSL